MSRTTERDIKKVRIFLRKIAWNKILAFSFFVIISSVLWFMQIYNKTFETNLKIPVKYISVPDSVVFTDSLPDEINVRIRDYGHTMFKYHFREVDTILVDVSLVIDNDSPNKNLQGSALEKYIDKSLTQTSQILSYEPTRISLLYNTLRYRKVPIVFDGQISLAPGYFLNGDIRILPDSVMAYGTAADLAKLTYAYTTNDTINGLDLNSEIPFDLVGKKNIKYSLNKVNVFVPVEAYRQMRIEVPVECLNLPDNMIVKFFPSGVSLSFFVGVSIADSVKFDDFAVGVDYNGLKDARSVSVPVRITSSPAYARSLTIDPPEVEYIFEYKDAKQK